MAAWPPTSPVLQPLDRVMTRPTRLPPSELDRLVDGELSPAEATQLIRAFEETPDGWKQCALAFLEAQAWQQTLRALVPSPQRPPAQQPRVLPSSRWRSTAAAALTTLVVMLFGVLLGSQLNPASPNQPAPAVASTSPGRSAGQTSRPSSASHGDGPWQLVVDSPAGRAAVPVYSPTDRRLAQAWQDDSELWWETLRKAGVPIDERQRWYGVALENGHQVWLPVREVRWRGEPSASFSDDLDQRLRQLASSRPDDPIACQVRRWLQKPPSGQAVRVLRIGPGVLIDPDRGSLDSSALANRLERLEQDLQDLQLRLRRVLAKRRRLRTGQ